MGKQGIPSGVCFAGHTAAAVAASRRWDGIGWREPVPSFPSSLSLFVAVVIRTPHLEGNCRRTHCLLEPISEVYCLPSAPCQHTVKLLVPFLEYLSRAVSALSTLCSLPPSYDRSFPRYCFTKPARLCVTGLGEKDSQKDSQQQLGALDQIKA